MKQIVFILTSLLVVVLGTSALAKDKAALIFTELHDKQLEAAVSSTEDWHGQARLVTFWRSDCAPCLKEITILPEIARQNPELFIDVISLHDTEHTRPHLKKMPENIRILVAEDEGRIVLSAFGNDRMLALPYSVMLDAKGQVCDWHFGIIAPEKVSTWRKKCS